jgi:hypothetical protein
VAFGTVPAGSFVRVKSRFRLYSASAALFRAAVFPDADFFATDFFVAGFFATARFVTGLFAADFGFVSFFGAAFLVELFFTVVRFVTGRFTVRVRVVAMMAPWCEEHADGLARVGGSERQDVRGSRGLVFSHSLTF